MQYGAAEDGETAQSWRRRHGSLIIGIVASLIVHGLILLVHQARSPLNAASSMAGVQGPLAVTLAAPPAPASSPADAPPVVHEVPRHPTPPRAKPSAPPVLAVPTPAPQSIAPPTPLQQPQPPQPVPAPPPMDMMAQLDAARRRRREQTGFGAADEQATVEHPDGEAQQAMNNAMRNLRTLASNGRDDSGSGGVFQVLHVGYDNAEFEFHGWNTNFQRRLNEIVPVVRGTHDDIRMAIIDKMIDVIRRYESREFTWESHRLGRTVTLSARPEDTRGLEEFLMLEFFPEYFNAAHQ